MIAWALWILVVLAVMAATHTRALAPIVGTGGLLAWRLPLLELCASPSPVAVGAGVVVFGCQSSNGVFAINASSGASLWNQTTGNIVPAQPVVADGVVYVGSWDQYFYALNLTTGAVLWRHWVTAPIAAGAALGPNGVVFFGTAYSGTFDNVYALDTRRNGTALWTYAIGNTSATSLFTALAAADGVVVVAVPAGLTALDATTGARLWYRENANPTQYSAVTPAISDGVCFYCWGTHVHALNALTGAELWNFTKGAPSYFFAPAVAGGVVYLGCSCGAALALDAISGASRWTQLGLDAAMAPTLDPVSGVVYVQGDSDVYALNTTDGTLEWRYRKAATAMSAAAVWNGTVIAVDYATVLYAIAPCFAYNITTATAPLACRVAYGGRCGDCEVVDSETCQSALAATVGCTWCQTITMCTNPNNTACDCTLFHRATCEATSGAPCAWCATQQICANPQNSNCDCGEYPRAACDAAAAGTCHWCADNATCRASNVQCAAPPKPTSLGGLLLWKHAFVNTAMIDSPAAVSSVGILVIGAFRSVVALNVTTGVEMWSYPSPGVASDSPTVGGDGRVYFGAANSFVIFALNETSGALLWSTVLAAGTPSAVRTWRDRAFVTAGDTLYVVSAATGEQIWNFSAGQSMVHAPAVSDDGSVVFVGSDRFLLALNASDAAVIWNLTTEFSGLVISARVVDGRVFAVSDTLYAVNASSGALIWSIAGQRNRFTFGDPVPGPGNRVFVPCTRSTLCALDATTGRFLWNFTASLSTRSVSLSANDSSVVYVSSYDWNVYALDAATGVVLWRYTTGGAAVATTTLDGVVYASSDDGAMYALAPCFTFAENSCPAACRVAYGRCGDCTVAGVAVCQSRLSTAGGFCRWCGAAIGMCANANLSCDCGVYPESACNATAGSGCHWCVEQNICANTNNTNCDCAYFGEATCAAVAAATGTCAWCGGIGMCANAATNRDCDCSYFGNATCSAMPGSACHWCAALQLCANPNNTQCHCTGFPLAACDDAPPDTCNYCENHRVCAPPVASSQHLVANLQCTCPSFDEATCLATSSTCGWQARVFDGSTSRGYCAATTGCQAITCEGVLDPETCVAAGCKPVGALCQSSTCFSFFLPRFVSQPYLLFALGVLKDVAVLLLIGAVGDKLARAIAMRTHPAKQWYHGRTTPLRLDETVYISDDACRDGRAGGAANESFSAYCGRVADALFDFDDDASDIHDERIDSPQRRAALLDAVAFALFDESCWINLDGERATHGRDDGDDGDVQLIESPRGADGGGGGGDAGGGAGAESGACLLASHKLQLTDADFASAVALQERVTAAVLERATTIVYFTQSRDIWVSVASAVNTFPSLPQLVFYHVGIVSLFASTLYSVVGNSKNLADVERIAGYDCNATLTSAASAAVSNATGAEAALKALSSTSVQQAAYFLIGFRFVNASTFATAVLVFVKLARGLYQRHCGLHLLTLSQRLPIMSVASSRAVQAMLVVYVLLVAPFALGGATYGWSLSAVCGAPVLVGVALVALDALLLAAFRRLFAGAGAAQSDGSHDGGGGRGVELVAGHATDPLNSSVRAVAALDEPVDDGQDEATLARFFDVDRRRAEESRAALAKPPPVTSIASAAPITLPRALLVFLLAEELPMIFISLSLQAAFNYTAFVHFGKAFALSNDATAVVGRDYDSRRFGCVVGLLESDVSALLATLSSFVPFL